MKSMKKCSIFGFLFLMLSIGLVSAQLNTTGSTSSKCISDSDGGINYYVSGTLNVNCGTDSNGISPACGIWRDSCSDEKTLIEYYCEGNNLNDNFKTYTCPSGCKDGACIRESGQDSDCLKENESGVYGERSCCHGLKEEVMQTASIGSVPRIICNKCTGNNCISGKSSLNQLCENGKCKNSNNSSCEFDYDCNNNSDTLVGNDSDSHGCKGSAGYSWCEEKKKCLRVWEENCSDELPGEGKIKILPETASLRARERLGELGFNISLKETGKGNDTQYYYEAVGRKEVKLFWLFKTKAKIVARIDTQNGNVTKIEKPWWNFLASGF